MLKKICKALTILFVLTILTSFVTAIGISPASFEIPYKPGEEATFEYAVRVGDSESNNVQVYASGDFKDMIIIGEKEKTLSPGQWTKSTFKIKFPLTPQMPGLHENRLGIVEKSSAKREGVSVLAGVETRLLIRVPFEGRYLELKKFEIPPGEVNKPVNFYATVISRGKEDIDSAVMNLDILDSQGQLLAKIKSDSVSIKKDQEVTLTAQWQTSVPGPYSANGFILYDENFLELGPKSFNVGDVLLKIENLLAPEVIKGEIAKISFDIKSFWNNNIGNVYAELTVKDQQGTVLSQEKSQTLTVNAWSTIPVVMYWDSRNQEIGEYEGKIILHYLDKTDEATAMIRIKKPFILTILKQSPFLIIILVILLIILIFNILLFIKMRKRKKDENQK